MSEDHRTDRQPKAPPPIRPHWWSAPCPARWLGGALGLTLGFMALPAAHGQEAFAQPFPSNDGPVAPEADAGAGAHAAPPALEDRGLPSDVRILVGPTLRLAAGPVGAGLGAAVDIGRGAAGLRLTAHWTESRDGPARSGYGGDLWVDFLPGGPWHPVLGVGAQYQRMSGATLDGRADVAMGTLRGSLQYRLPLEDTPGRAFVDGTLMTPFAGGNGAGGTVQGGFTAGLAIGF